ncbi:MAG: hypothetical protein EPO65_02680 [Dehalococcoidia bacterium]|nr:MAG: hypothetical protein EPO65_02680 [Dehalococcoidia bacterium]
MLIVARHHATAQATAALPWAEIARVVAISRGWQDLVSDRSLRRYGRHVRAALDHGGMGRWWQQYEDGIRWTGPPIDVPTC